MKKIKKKELLKRIEALEAIVDDLQKDSEKAEGLGEKKELEVGKWYKCKGEDLFITYNTHERYGIDCDGNWFEGESLLTGFYRDYYEATPQEVEEALIKEAKKRYKVGDKLRKIYDDFSRGSRMFNNEIIYRSNNNTLWIEDTYGYISCIFKDGKWAEIVEDR